MFFPPFSSFFPVISFLPFLPLLFCLPSVFFFLRFFSPASPFSPCIFPFSPSLPPLLPSLPPSSRNLRHSGDVCFKQQFSSQNYWPCFSSFYFFSPYFFFFLLSAVDVLFSEGNTPLHFLPVWWIRQRGIKVEGEKKCGTGRTVVLVVMIHGWW